MEINKCTPMLDADKAPMFKIPKKDWDYLRKEGFLTKAQVLFLKKAENLGFSVYIDTQYKGFGIKRGDKAFAVSKIVIEKELHNYI